MTALTANVRRPARNPLRADPTRTATLRRLFETDLRKRFARLKGRITRLIDDEDALGLREKPHTIAGLVGNERWKFLTSQEKVAAFQLWLAGHIQSEILAPPNEAENAYWVKYVQDGYAKGAGRAFDDTKKAALWTSEQQGAFFAGSKDQFLRQSFGQPETIEKAKLLAGRVFTDLKGVTEAMGTQMSRTLTDGLVRGQNPREIAKALNETVDGIGKRRAETIARTEIIRAHAEGQLDALESLGVEEIGVMVEWSTAGDDRVCPLCAALEGIVMKLDEARGTIPRHPNCRCAYLPANVGEGKKGQKRGPVQLAESRNKSLELETGYKDPGEAKKFSKWPGADVKFSKVRPKDITDAATPPLKSVAETAAKVVDAPKLILPKETLKFTAAEAEAIEQEIVKADFNNDGQLNPKKWFKGKNTEGLPHGSENGPFELVDLNISDLASTQTSMDAEGVRFYAKGVGRSVDDLPQVVKFGDEYLVADGHHRLTAQAMAGRTRARVLLTEVDVYDASTHSAKFKLPTQAVKELAAKQAAEELAAKQAAEALAAKKAEEEAAARLAAEMARKAEQARQSAIAAETAGELPDLVDLQKLKSLPGSTRPDLMQNVHTGKQWVMKSTQAGIQPGHLQSEALADDLYRVLGHNVPRSGIVQTAEGPVKLAEFLENGQTLGDWVATATPAQQKAMFKKISDGFVTDALLANHDVAGLNLDNILIVGGKAYRIDNGGALLYRAQGAQKANFGATVVELESMRNAAINPQTQRIFAGLTDDMLDKQTAAILKKRKALLSAIPDEGLRDTIAARLDYLEGRLKARAAVAPTAKEGAKGTATAAERAKARLPEPGILEDTAERVRASRINGVVISGDRDMVEDLSILAWQEVDEAGRAVTRLQLKVTPKGSQAIESKLGDAIKTAQAQAPTGGAPSGRLFHPADEYWSTVESGAKTVALHAKDGNYNAATLEYLAKTEKMIAKGLKTAKDPSTKAMLEYYAKAIDDINKAKAAGKTPNMITRYTMPKPSVEPTATASPFKLRQETMRFPISKIENGHARRISDYKEVSRAKQYVIDAGDGAEIRFVPSTGMTYEQPGLAFHGNVDVIVQGEVTTETLQNAMAKLRSIGIDTTPPTAAYEEALYIHRSVYLRNDHHTGSYRAIWESSLPDEEKLVKLKAWASEQYGADFSKLKEYNPQGITNTGFGDGPRRWERWDLPAAKIEKEMKDYVLHHSTGAPIEDVVNSMLQTGGEVTPTAQRIRKGIRITSGQSPDADIESGGASYFFTRIRTRTNAADESGFQFKIRNLARQDAVTYHRDRYGAISGYDERRSTIAQYKAIAKKNAADETNLKGGLSLLDDLEKIVVYDNAQRQKVLDAFRNNKVTHLNDGRAVEDIVQARYDR